MLDVIIVLVLLSAAVIVLPNWRYSRNWGYLPSGAISALLLVFILFWYIVPIV